VYRAHNGNFVFYQVIKFKSCNYKNEQLPVNRCCDLSEGIHGLGESRIQLGG